MNSSLYIGATGMKSLSEGMNVTTNNIANSSTLGYKQQNILFSDLMYTEQASLGSAWGAQEESFVALGQVGHGVQVDSVRTIYTQGAMQIGSDVTDMALSGKGFFQVTGTEGETLYTRAGNFRFNNEGFLTLPGGEVLNGYPVSLEGVQGALEPIQVDHTEPMPAKNTSELTLGFNFGNMSDATASTTNPFFSMAERYDGTQEPPLYSDNYSHRQDLRIFDANGEAQTLTLYVDGTGQTDPQQVLEFLVAANGSGGSSTDEAGEALLTGTLTFNSSGELIDMSAFSPSGDTQDLANWTPSTLKNGAPVLTYAGQEISLNFGLTTEGDWQNAPASAADVGTDPQLLASMGSTVQRSTQATTATAGGNSLSLNTQDGYPEGRLADITINDSGHIIGIYSNGQEAQLYEIPVARFTSEDGLRREGGNFFSATPESGNMDLGTAGTENFASIHANTLEMSNVDMSTEMVNMIITQRGFQSNSKVVTTADAMLQKAMELKRM